MRDYILCKRCECKIVYDGDDTGRERIETLWGNPAAGVWTPLLMCPACIASQEGEATRLRAELAAWRSALAKVGPYYIPATNVSDEEAEEVYAAIDAARKGEGAE